MTTTWQLIAAWIVLVWGVGFLGVFAVSLAIAAGDRVER